ncbi:TetR/AcrR family transcriptional regulator [Rhizohabitans arisaemae]|uniref:TetR/AcrR family transcriptional regulator n=1 Tax=Rhizohabitans arisaemae TaxID=2720610 RepID=UPI0024B0D61A|nr:TetR family transcriptional regulator [Rhizohabitans arisaemae]
MSEDGGLRARKKARTRQTLSDTAIAMFLADGFDAVSVSDIAAAAEVSKPTLFRYFASKEDLLLHRIADHRGEAARTVRDRRPGETPLDALHRSLVEKLDRRDPVSGLCDHPQVLAYHRLVFTTPSIASRVIEYGAAETEALAEALAEAVRTGLAARLTAAQVIAVQQELARDTWSELAAGRSADEVHPEAVHAADTAYALLKNGAAGHGY